MKEDYIEKKFILGGTEFVAWYTPSTGEFSFGKDILNGIDLSLTNYGAFKTMRELANSFKDLDISKITYFAQGKDLEETVTKDKLYERTLRRLGYVQKEDSLNSSDRENLTNFSYNSFGKQWKGPKRLWVKKEKNLESLANSSIQIVFLLSFFGGIFCLSPVFTGKVIADLDVNLNIGLGFLMFVISLIVGLFYFNNKKRK